MFFGVVYYILYLSVFGRIAHGIYVWFAYGRKDVWDVVTYYFVTS